MLFDKGEPSRLDATGRRSVPFTYDKSGVVIHIVVNGATAAMSLDTAATTSMVRKNAKLAASIASPCSGKPGDLHPGCDTLGFDPLRVS